MLLHPRCVNCHPPDDRPRQGDRHAGARSARGARRRRRRRARACTARPATRTATSSSPACPARRSGTSRRSRWRGSAARRAQICAQIKDPARNGGKTLEQIWEHSAHDELVAWGWTPGHGRDAGAGHAEGVRRPDPRLDRHRRRVPAGHGGHPMITLRVNGAEHQRRRRSRDAAAVGAARPHRPHRHQVRLRRGAVRRVHRAPRRRGGALLRDAGVRAPRARRSPPSRACPRTATTRCRRRGSSWPSRSAGSARRGRS